MAVGQAVLCVAGNSVLQHSCWSNGISNITSIADVTLHGACRAFKMRIVAWCIFRGLVGLASCVHSHGYTWLVFTHMPL